MSDLSSLKTQLREFAREREWEQFHTPRNLLLALVGEVGELAEIFQWLSENETNALMRETERRRAVEAELADVLIYLVRLADVLAVDLVGAAQDKLRVNRERYPLDTARDSSRKYTELTGD